jgi:putative membrane protein
MYFQDGSLRNFLLHLLVSGLAVFLTSKLVSGFKVRGFFVACMAALVIGVVNFLLWWLLMFLALPLTVLTLGLFIFVVNGALLKIAAAVMPGFEIDSWLAAIFGAIVLSLLNWGLHAMFAV